MFKRYKDNVRTVIRAEEVYTEDSMIQAISEAVDEYINNLTNYCNDPRIDKYLSYYKEFLNDDVGRDDYREYIEIKVFTILGDIYRESGRVDCGDYELMTNEVYDRITYGEIGGDHNNCDVV